MLNTPIDARSLGLPLDVWALIANKLPPVELNHFIRAVKLFRSAGTQLAILKEACNALYPRLCALDPSLETKLKPENFVEEYKVAFNKIRDRQEEEIAYLTENYPAIVAPILAQPGLHPNPTPLQFLEDRNRKLDDINIAIITPLIQPNETELNLRGLGITRLPQRLLTDPAHQAYFQQLTEINCNQNNIHSLIIKNLPQLSSLKCKKSELYHLLIDNLPELMEFDCSNNNLTGKLDLTAFKELNNIVIYINRLTHLDVQGLHFQGLFCQDNKLEELIVDSSAVENIIARNNKLKTIIVTDISELPNAVTLESDQFESEIDIRNNPLVSISPNLIQKFGQNWADVMLVKKTAADIVKPAAASATESLEMPKMMSTDEVMEEFDHFLANPPSLLMQYEQLDVQMLEGSQDEEMHEPTEEISYRQR